MTPPVTQVREPLNGSPIYPGVPLIYYSYYHTPFSAARYAELLQTLPDSFRNKIKRFVRWQDALASLLGKLLLLIALKEHHYSADLEAIEYTKFGKPYLPHIPDFNISHSGHLVVCAVFFQGRIGIDVEWNRSIDITDFRSQLSPQEWLHLEKATSPESLFYKYWTIKEAILKADGRGLSYPLSFINAATGDMIAANGQIWYITPVQHFENYTCHIATDINCNSVYQLQKIDFTQAII